MPTVSTGGTPLAVIAPSAAAISRHTTPEDARFAALLPPIAAELIKGGSKSAQSETAVAQYRIPGRRQSTDGECFAEPAANCR